MKKIDCSVFLFTLGAIALSSGIAVTGCSPDIEGGKKGELYVNEQSVTLQVSKQNAPQLQSEFFVRNEGDDAFNITEIRVVNGPGDRVVLLGDKSETSTCGADELSISTACYKKGAPSMPITLAAGANVPVLFAVTDGNQDLRCKEAPDYVPAEMRDHYCGEIRITTDSGTNSELIKNGVATVYLQYNGGSGKAEVEFGIIKIEGILPSTEYTKKFKIKNVGSGPLTINSLSFSKSLPEKIGSVSVSPSGQSTISNGASNEYTITYTSGTSSDDFDESVELVINSTSVESAKLVLSLTTQEPPAPILSYDKSMLNFNTTEKKQEFTITNRGNAKLFIRSLSLVPAKSSTDPDQWYEILDENDTRVTGRITINDGESKTFKVHYKSDPQNKDHVAYLVIRSNDNYYGADSKIILAANNPPGPFGEVYPVGLYVNKKGSEQKRTFVVRNLGTGPLDISKFYFESNDYDSIFDFEKGPSGNQVQVSSADLSVNSISAFALARTGINWDQPQGNGKVKFKADNDLSGKFTEGRHRLSEGINLELDENALEGTLGIEVLRSPVEGKLVNLKVKPGTGFTADYFKNNDVDCLWMLTKRPDNSRLFIFDRIKCTNPFIMRPDVSGDYTIYVRPDVKAQNSTKIYGYATQDFSVAASK